MDKEFNLLRESWIRVLYSNGAVGETSILEALAEAHNISRLAGELPTQDAALLRLLLAVLYSAYAREIADLRREADAIAFWQMLMENGRFDLQKITAYLEQYEERFWLFHPQTPFYQIAGLSVGTKYLAEKLAGDLSESSNKPRLFAGRSGDGKRYLEYPEAARWLLHLNAFDDTSGKATTRGGEKKPSTGGADLGKLAYLGKLGLVYADGENLFEMLMLNFITRPPDGDDRPVWEEEPCALERRVIAPPDTYAKLFTLQSRRFLLKREADKVTGFILLGGDNFDVKNTFIEYMTVWQKDRNNYKPKPHDPEKSFWRDFAALTAKNDGTGKSKPGIVSWIATLRKNQLLPRPCVAFKTAGIKYGDKNSFVDDVFSDSVTVNAGILDAIDRNWVTRICEALDKTEECVKALRRFASKLEIAAGKRNDPKAKDKSSKDKSFVKAAAVQAYFDLDLPFRRWLARIDPDRHDKGEKVTAWLKEVREMLCAQAKEMLEKAGTRALTGKNSAIPQYSNFIKDINKYLYKENKNVGQEKLIYRQMQGRLYRLDADTPEAKATLARLRRGIGKPPGAAPEIFEITIGGLPEELAGKKEPSFAEYALYTALTLYALHRQGAEGGRHRPKGDSIGGAARRLARSQDDFDRIRRRFDTILTAGGPLELAQHARALVQLMRAAAAPIYLDWAQFAVDLFRFQRAERRDGVRLQWGRDFYRSNENSENIEGDNANEESLH